MDNDLEERVTRLETDNRNLRRELAEINQALTNCGHQIATLAQLTNYEQATGRRIIPPTMPARY